MKKLVFRNILIIVLLFLVFGLIIFEHKSKLFFQKVEPEVIVPEDTKLSLVMVGDNLIHGAVYADAKTGNGYDFKPMFLEMKSIISSYDLAFINQESILGGTELGLSSYPRFNSPYEVGDALLDSGFDLVALANNHTLDKGEVGITNSVNYWKSKGVYYSGSSLSYEERDTIKVEEKNDISYALLSYTCWTNGINVPNGKDYLLNRYDEELVKKHIENIRDKVDVVMVSMHWGDEYSHTPSAEQRKIANYLSSLGVDIIIGHHPHVVQPIEFIDDTVVIYSLGNFLSAQRGIEKLTGLMVSLDIEKDGETGDVSINNINTELTYTYSNYNKGYRGNFKIYPYTKLTESILPNYESYYNKYMGIVINGDTRIGKSDYSGDIK